jgi:radical SAM superfamily enzyme YgiQ (UPF0313 family)
MKVIILSVPHCEPYPMVAPVLLSACLNQAGISALGIDFNIKFIEHFCDKPYYADLKNFLSIGYAVNIQLPPVAIKEVYRFTKKFLQDLHNAHNPEYIGLSIFTAESLDFSLVFCYMLRRYFPNTKIIVGGKGIELNYSENKKHYQRWADHGMADLVIVGDAETEIINSIHENKRGLVISAPQTKQDLDQIPLPEWHSYDLKYYSNLTHLRDQQSNNPEPYMAITGSKGCVRKCTFCDVASFWPDFIYRDPVRVADEIIYNYHHTGIRSFVFTDNLINGSITNYRAMNQRLVDVIPGEIAYRGYAIFRGKHQMPDDDFRLAASAGCKMWYIGVESGSEKVRYDMKKKFNNDDLDWSVNALHKYDISQSWLLIVGYPSETEKDFEDTKNLLRRYAHLAHTKKIQIGVSSPFSLLHNSPLLHNQDLAADYGLSHNTHSNYSSKFWTSTRYIDNDYPTRSRRWKELTSLTEELGYIFQSGMTLDKWKKEMDSLDEIYNESTTKIFTIRSN